MGGIIAIFDFSLGEKLFVLPLIAAHCLDSTTEDKQATNSYLYFSLT